ncbi:MAG: hypothetical protein WD266_01310 [Balneolales bacterium]
MADTNKQHEDLLYRFLDGELGAEREKPALHMIADNPDLRDMLRFDHALHRAVSEPFEPGAFNVPEGFDDRVMSAVEARQPVRAAVSSWDRAKAFAGRLMAPAPLQIRPVYAMAALLLLTVTFSSVLDRDQSLVISDAAPGPIIETIADQDQQVWIRFVYFDDEAESMAVAGDFSGWDPISLTQEEVGGKRVWTGLVAVTHDEHRYMFVKDGEQWVTDPLAEVYQDDGFGNKNAVLFL